MKKTLLWIVLLLCLMMVWPAMAEETTLQPVPVDRMLFFADTIPGLVAKGKEVSEPGVYRIYVDDDTKWETVMLHTGAQFEVLLHYGVKGPEWATRYTAITGNGWSSDEEIISAIHKKMGSDDGIKTSTESTNSYPVAAYTEEKSILSPMAPYHDQYESFVHAILWQNDDGSQKLYEVMKVFFDHESNTGRIVEQLKIAAEDIVPNASNLSGVTAEIEDGRVIYTLDPEKWNSQEVNVATRIKAPTAETTSFKIFTEWGTSSQQSVINDYGEVFFHVASGGQPETSAESSRLSIVWYEGDKPVEGKGGSLVIYRVNSLHHAPWMYYAQKKIEAQIAAGEDVLPWKPAQLRSVKIGTGAPDRVDEMSFFQKDINPTTGHVHISTTDVTPSIGLAQELAQAIVSYEIQPPANARYATDTRNSRNRFWGENADAYNDNLYRLTHVDERDMYPLAPGKTLHLHSGVFSELATPIENVMLYATGLETEPERGAAHLICWFDEYLRPIEINYIAESADRIVLEPETESYETEVDVKHPVKGPVFIDGKNTGWKLRAEYHVQSGTNAYMVDLHIEDKHGNPVDLKKELGEGEKIVFYLPYREHEDFSKYTFFLTHYEGGDFNRGVSVDVTPTDKGIRFEVDNLSPFVVSWDDGLGVQFFEEELEVTEDLYQAGFDNPDAIYNAFVDFAAESYTGPFGLYAFEGVLRENGVEVTPDGKTGYTAYMNYPEGTNPDHFRFRVFHMTDMGPDAGLIEELPCEPTAEGLKVTFLHLSPIAISYEELPAVPASLSLPQTGDNTPIILYLSVLCLSAIGYAFIMRRKMHG